MVEDSEDGDRVSAAGGGGVGGGGPGSVHSKGSGSKKSGTSATSVTEVLRRGVNARNSVLERSLVMLQRAILTIFVLVAAMNIASLVVTTSLFQQLTDNLALVVTNGDRGNIMQSILSSVQRLSLSAEGKFDLSPYHGFNGSQRILKHNIDTFERLHQQLYLAVDGQLEAETALYTNASIPVVDLIPGTYVSRGVANYTVRRVNLANLGLEFVSKARQVNAMSPSEIVISNGPVWWINENAWTLQGMRDAMNSSIILSSQRSATQAATVNQASVAVLIAGISLLLAVSAFVIIPSLASVFAATTSIYGMFLTVPVPIVRALRAQRYKKLLALRRAADELDAGLDVGGAGEVATGGGGDGGGGRGRHDSDGDGMTLDDDGSNDLKMAVNTYANRMARERAAAAGVGGGDRGGSASGGVGGCCGCCRGNRANDSGEAFPSASAAGAAAAAEDKAVRKYHTTSSGRGWVVVRMMLPVVAFIGYYVGMYVWTIGATSLSEDIKREVLWSKQVQFYSPRGAYGALLTASYCDREYGLNKLDRLESAVTFMDQLQDELLYGSATRGVRAGMQVSPTTLSLFSEDGCVPPDPETSVYTLQECRETFMSGLLSTAGLRAGLTEYTQRIHTYLRDREAELKGNNCTTFSMNTGIGYEIMSLGGRLLLPGFTKAATARYTEGLSALTAFTSAVTAVTIMSVVFLLVLYVAVYQPLVRKLDAEIKDCRALLLLFPDEVCRVVPSIVAAARGWSVGGAGGGRG